MFTWGLQGGWWIQEPGTESALSVGERLLPLHLSWGGAATRGRAPLSLLQSPPSLPLSPPCLAASQFCLELYNPSCRGQKIKACKTDSDGRVVEGKHESYRVSAASAQERDQWIEAIRASITRVPFYDLVSTRKKKIASKQ